VRYGLCFKRCKDRFLLPTTFLQVPYVARTRIPSRRSVICIRFVKLVAQVADEWVIRQHGANGGSGIGVTAFIEADTFSRLRSVRYAVCIVI
jgi:hypothetical protein